MILKAATEIQKELRRQRVRAELAKLSTESGVFSRMATQADGRCPICGVRGEGVCRHCGNVVTTNALGGCADA